MYRSVSATEEWTRHTVPTTVGDLAVWDRGTGPAVVLRHGIFFDHMMWQHQSHALAGDHRVLTVDGPGHGQSGDPGRPYSLDDDARATLEVMDHLGVDCAALVGHSWGGMSAVRTALIAPARVRALALVDTPLEPSSTAGRLRYAMLRALVLAVGLPGWYSAQVAKAMFSDSSRRRNRSLVLDFQRQLATASPTMLSRAMSAVLVDPDTVLDRLGGLTQSVLVLAGDEDYVLPPSTRSALERLVPHAPIEILPGKHALPLEQPNQVQRRLEVFLAGVER